MGGDRHPMWRILRHIVSKAGGIPARTCGLPLLRRPVTHYTIGSPQIVRKPRVAELAPTSQATSPAAKPSLKPGMMKTFLRFIMPGVDPLEALSK